MRGPEDDRRKGKTNNLLEDPFAAVPIARPTRIAHRRGTTFVNVDLAPQRTKASADDRKAD